MMRRSRAVVLVLVIYGLVFSIDWISTQTWWVRCWVALVLLLFGTYAVVQLSSKPHR